MGCTRCGLEPVLGVRCIDFLMARSASLKEINTMENDKESKNETLSVKGKRGGDGDRASSTGARRVQGMKEGKRKKEMGEEEREKEQL